jgi:hypothetical protein
VSRAVFLKINPSTFRGLKPGVCSEVMLSGVLHLVLKDAVWRRRNIKGRIEMDKNFSPEKYGMVICPLCAGKGFLIKDSEGTGVSVRKVCIKCGGFGAVKKEEEAYRSLEN